MSLLSLPNLFHPLHFQPGKCRGDAVRAPVKWAMTFGNSASQLTRIFRVSPREGKARAG